MAYLVPKKQDQQQMPGSSPGSAPTLSGGSPMSQPIGGSSSAAPPQSPMQQPMQAQSGPQPMQNAGRSGRFTNLQTILGQNQGIGQQVGQAGKTALGAAKTSFNTAAQPLRDASFTANTNWQQPFNNLTTLGPGGGLNQSSMDQLRSMLGQQYGGPGAMSFDLQGNKDIQKTASLGNATTAGKELAVGPYSGSASRLDQAMFGGSGEVRKEMNALNKDRKGFVKGAGEEMGKLNDKVSGFADSAAAARDAVRNGLLGAGYGMMGDLENRVKSRNDQEIADKLNGVVRDSAGNVIPLAGFEQINGWSGPAAGTGANFGNTVTAEESSRFNALRDLLGIPEFGIDRTGDYASGYNTYGTVDPELVVTPNQGKTNTNDASDPETQRQLDVVKRRDARQTIKNVTGF